MFMYKEEEVIGQSLAILMDPAIGRHHAECIKPQIGSQRVGDIITC